MEADPSGSLEFPHKRQKLESSLYDVESKHSLPEAPSTDPTMEADLAHEPSVASSDERAKEAMYGITEFVNTELLGFCSILKKRYTDFQVNEILPSGEVVHLTSFNPPKREQKLELSNWSTFAAANGSKSQSQVGPNEDGTERSLPSVKQEETDTDTRLDPTQSQSENNLPALKSDVDQPERVSPHKRILATSSPTPSMQDHQSEQPEAPTRKKSKAIIRKTSRGWVEVDQEQEEKLVKDAAGDAGVHQEESSPEKSVKEGAQPAEVRYEPKSSTPAQWQAFAGANASGRVATDFQLKDTDRDLLTQYLGPDTVNSLVALYERTVNSPHRKAKDHGIVRSAAISRETRSRIHQEIRNIFSSRLESVTDNDGSIVITAATAKSTFHTRTPVNNGRDRESNQKRWIKPTWEELGGEYLHFTLYKENKDTMECISWLAKELQMRPGRFQFAGTKDRRAVTVQRVSVYRVFADRMASAGRTLRNAKIGNFEYRPSALQLGELSGNEFVVTLRDCDFHYPIPMDSKTIGEGAQLIISAAIKSLTENGYINYYGLQRFGTFSTSTSEVGVRMLQGDLEAAVDAILHFAPASLMAAQDPTSTTDRVSREDQARAYAIHAFKTTGHANLYDMPRKFSAEASIIRHLSKRGQNTDYRGALQTIPRNLRLMYVHAYQSMVWNVAASERWKRFGNTVIEGDLVLIDEHSDKTETVTKKEDVDEDGEAIVHPSADDRATDPDDVFTRARALSKEEAESGSYTVFDIVLPTPGYDILYPANEMEKFYKGYMASDDLDPHDMRRKWKDVSLSGSYRKLLAKPGRDISFEIRVYDDDDEQFVETDLDRLGYLTHGNTVKGQNVPLEAVSTHMIPEEQPKKAPYDSVFSPKSEFSDTETGGVRLSGGLYKDFKIAAILKFQLGTSQYATIALRELMKLGGVKVYKADFSGGR